MHAERYSHRNGETEPPTEEGYYWSSDNDTDYMSGVVQVSESYVFGSLSEFDKGYLELFKGQWWGPVTPPWDDTEQSIDKRSL